MDSPPFVSVIIPTYNHAPLLKIALESVIAQTFTNWEAIVVNNYSTDDTIDVVNSFADQRINLINFHNNGVIGSARNQGLHLSKGRFVAFLDSDDSWYPTKLQKCVDQTHHGFQFISHGELWINNDLTQRKVMYGPAERSTYLNLLYRGNCISTSATFIEKSLIDLAKGFDEDPNIVTVEDYDLWMRIAQQSPKTYFIPEILGTFNRLTDSASSAVMKNMNSELVVLNKHFDQQKRSVANQLRMRHRTAIANYGAARQLSNRPNQSLQLFCSAWRLSPFVLRIYPGILLALLQMMRTKQTHPPKSND